MKNKSMIIGKLARNAHMLGLTVLSQDHDKFVVDNGSNDLTVSYEEASFSPSVVGGVDDMTNPFLGAGTLAPGKIKIKSVNASTIPSITDVIDSSVAAQLLVICSSMGNDVILENGSTIVTTLRGHSDLLGVGQ